MQARSEAGLTLVEVLVVLAIIGLVGSVVVLGSSGADGGGKVQAEAQRLAAAIQSAADEAMVTDRPAALNWDAEGYAFVQWDVAEEDWRPHQSAGLRMRHEVSDGVSLASDLADGPVRIGGDHESERFNFILEAKGQRWRVEFDGLNAAATPEAGG